MDELLEKIKAIIAGEGDDEVKLDKILCEVYNDGNDVAVYNTPWGSEVEYAHPDNGWPHQKEETQKLLTVGKIYTLDRTRVGNSSTKFILDEFPGREFNSVMFKVRKVCM